MQPGDAEDSHDRVADVLLDRAAMSDEHVPHLLEEPCHHPTDGFRVHSSPIGVDPTTSQNTIETVFRDRPSESTLVSGVAHDMQKRAGSGLS